MSEFILGVDPDPLSLRSLQNAVVGLEVTLDPFARKEETDASGLRLHAVGTAAKLEPLF